MLTALADLSPETIRLLRLLQQRIRAVLHGRLARHRSTAKAYATAFERIEALEELAPKHRLERAELLLGGLSESFLSRHLDTIAGAIPEACDGLLYTELAAALIDDERCHFTGFGNIQVRDGGKELSFAFKGDRALLGLSYDPPSSSDLQIQVAINSWHADYEFESDSDLPYDMSYDTLASSYLLGRLPAAIANVRRFGALSNAEGHSQYSLHCATAAYGIYACCLLAIASILRTRGSHDVHLIGRFRRAGSDRLSFEGAPEFIALLASNLPIHA